MKIPLSRFIGLMICVAALVAPLGAARAQVQPKFTDIVVEVASTAVNIYEAPGATKVVRVLGVGERALWDGSSRQVNGRIWIPVYLLDALALGWATPDNNALYQVDTFRLTPGMEIGASGTVAAPRMIYDTPSLTAQRMDSTGSVQLAQPGSAFRVLEGPVYEKLYVWWRVQFGNGAIGWIIDGTASLQVTKPLKVYGIPVCDNFNISRYGVAGWDSALPTIRASLAPNEGIACLASSNLRGDGTPVVTVLTQSTDPSQVQEGFRVFGLVAGQWAQIFAQNAPPYSRTERLGVYDLTGDGIPALFWMLRADGTGGYLTVQAFKYSGAAGFRSILNLDSLYKGNVQVGVGNLVVFQPILRDNEPNCCPSGYNRVAYQWASGQFVKVLEDFPLPPYLLQPNG